VSGYVLDASVAVTALTEPGSGAADLLADLIILPVERWRTRGQDGHCRAVVPAVGELFAACAADGSRGPLGSQA